MKNILINWNRKLKHLGYTNIITKSSKELDLTNQNLVAAFFNAEKPEYVFFAAGKIVEEGGPELAEKLEEKGYAEYVTA